MSIGKFTKSILVLGLLVTAAIAQDREQVLQQLAEAVSKGISNPEAFETNGFRIESSIATELGSDLEPNGNEFQMISIDSTDMFHVTVEKGRPGMSLGGGIGIFHGESGIPMMSFGDRDGDGRLDILDYLVLDEKGERALSVTDYELDGQPDIRIHWKERYFEIWHIDQWYRVAERDDRRGIFIEGKFIELRQENNRWIVP